MPWNDHMGPVPRRSEEEMLALVREKARAAGERRQGQLRAMGVAASLLFVVGLGALVSRTGADPTTRLETTSGDVSPPGTVEEPSSTTSAVPSVVTSSLSPLPPPPPTSTVTTIRRSTPSTAATSPPRATTSSTTTTLLCRNSVDPACGPFRWDPPLPPNQPLTVKVTHTPATPKAGETVTFRVVVDDADGSVLLDRTGIANHYGDGPTDGGGQRPSRLHRAVGAVDTRPHGARQRGPDLPARVRSPRHLRGELSVPIARRLQPGTQDK